MIIEIEPKVLVELLESGSEWHLKVTEGIPDGYRIVGCSMNEHGRLAIGLQHISEDGVVEERRHVKLERLPCQDRASVSLEEYEKVRSERESCRHDRSLLNRAVRNLVEVAAGLGIHSLGTVSITQYEAVRRDRDRLEAQRDELKSRLYGRVPDDDEVFPPYNYKGPKPPR